MPSTTGVDVELETLIRARYPIIYVVSWEERRVEETLREICQRRGKKMLLWTYTTGMAGNVASRDPLAALDYIMSAPDQSVFVLKDFHPFIGDVAVTRRLRDLVYALKTSYKTLVILSPLLKLPPELEKEITVVDYQLPTPADLDRLLEGIIQSVRSNPQIKTDLTPLEREQVLKAASGLTSNEAENVFARSLVEKRGFDIDVILGEKEQIIRKSGILEYYPATEAFADVGGMDLMKEWMQQRTASFNEEARRYGLPEPKGILLLGVQGCGKSLSAKAIASLWKLPLLRLDVGKIFAGIVGSSEENMRKAIATAESVAPCVAGDTRVVLADGSERTIRDLYDGRDEELTVLGLTDDWRTVPVRVKAVTRREAPDLFTIRTPHTTLQATSNHLHPVLRDGALVWVRTDGLAPGDHIAMPRALPTVGVAPSLLDLLPPDTRLYAPGVLAYARPEVQTAQRQADAGTDAEYVAVGELADRERHPAFGDVARFERGRSGRWASVIERLPERVNAEMAYLLGLIDSDGYLGKAGRIGLINTEAALHKNFATLLCGLFGQGTGNQPMDVELGRGKLKGTGEASTFVPCSTTYADNRLLAAVLRNLQARLLALPADLLRAYLRGYFDGDGFVSDPATGADPKVVLTSKVPPQNRLVRSVLLRAGFPTTNPDSANIEITGWESVRRFAREIGSDHPCRRARLEAWLAAEPPTEVKDRTDPIPVGASLRAARKAIGMGSQHFASASSSLLHRYEHGIGHPNRARLRVLLAEMRAWAERNGADAAPLDALERLTNSPVGWSEVKSVESAPTPEYVYDLACEGVHNFIANDLHTHNCVLWLDELEKGFSGTQSSGISDGGTTSRVFGTFITWLQDKKAPCFVVATSNDVSQLPPELMRKGRFDEIFFVDLPAAPERREIFEIHLKKRRRDPAKFDLDRLARAAVGYSGAEIEQAVVAALFTAFHEGQRELSTDDLMRAIRESVPLSVTMREGIQKLRDWADTRARPTSSTQSESTEELGNTESAHRFDASPGATNRSGAMTAEQMPPLRSPYEMEPENGDADEADPFEARLAALERKTATGLDIVNEQTQNAGADMGPSLPVVETQGTGTPAAPNEAAEPAQADPEGDQREGGPATGAPPA